VSAPIVVGACYRDPEDGEVVRALEEIDASSVRWRCVVLVGGWAEYAGIVTHRELDARWARVPDPTPAIAEDEL
jgi:hypothetical protein